MDVPLPLNTSNQTTQYYTGYLQLRLIMQDNHKTCLQCSFMCCTLKRQICIVNNRRQQTSNCSYFFIKNFRNVTSDAYRGCFVLNVDDHIMLWICLGALSIDPFYTNIICFVSLVCSGYIIFIDIKLHIEWKSNFWWHRLLSASV